MDRRQRKLAYFNEQFTLAAKMTAALSYSYQQTAAMPEAIWTQSVRTEEQAVALEALCARFARLADMLIQKLFRALDAIELVDEGSLLDRLARMEQRGVIDSMETWAEIRELRNQIAHDYVVADLAELQRSVFEFCPLLLGVLDGLAAYAAEKGWSLKNGE